MRELSLNLLDIAENSILDLLKLMIIDDGRGMDEETVKKVIDPFVTSRTTRKVGLGIPLLKEAAEACNGSLKITSEIGKGTEIVVAFQDSHIDRMPLGDIPTTFLNLLVANPQIHWIFTYSVNDKKFQLDDLEIKEVIGDLPLSEPEILSFLREMIRNGIKEVQN